MTRPLKGMCHEKAPGVRCKKSLRSRLGSVVALSLALVGLISVSNVSAIEIAGELFVNLDASTYKTGDAFWTNNGTYADFEAVAGPTRGFVETTPAIFFNGIDQAFVGGTLLDPEPAPEGLTGFDPTRTIEVWAINPSIASEETLLSWGKRGGPEGSNMSFNYGNNGMYGAVGHWGGGTHDMGWIDNDFTGGAPTANQWHHLVYTYDESVTRVYSDGELWNEEDTFDLYGGLDTHFDAAIAIASQWEPDGLTLTGGLKGSLAIGRIRIHDEVLSAAQILANYDEEKASFVSPEPPKPPVPEPIPFGPINRYSFTSDASDSIGGKHGVVVDEGSIPNAVFSGGMLDLSENTGEPSNNITEDAYVDLPNGMVTDAVKSGTDGAVSFEWWATVAEQHTWQRFGDFGSSNDGEDTANGGANAAYVLVTPNSGRYNNGLEITNHPDTNAAEPNVGVGGPFPLDEEQHVVAVYDHTDTAAGPNGTMYLYLNGELQGSNLIHQDMDLRTMDDNNNWLGRSQWPDAVFDGSYNEFRVFDYALTANQVLGNFEAGPDVLNIARGGDYNNDGVVNVEDIDLQSVAMKDPNPNLATFDENGDGLVNSADREIWVSQHAKTWMGDADFDGEFKSNDFVTVFLAGKYETNEMAGWAEGDWDGDMAFGSSDFVVAFLDGGYEVGPRTATAAVPEPSGLLLIMMAGLGIFGARRRRR